jgi:hypothetical protein
MGAMSRVFTIPAFGAAIFEVLIMSSYPKIWTDIFNDPWFTCLSCSQRGLWLQLIVFAKMAGDTAHVSGKSYSSMAHRWGMDDSTLRRNLRQFAIDGKIELFENSFGGITIKLVNYEYYQRDKRSEDKIRAERKNGEKSAKNNPLIREDKIREDNSKGDSQESLLPKTEKVFLEGFTYLKIEKRFYDQLCQTYPKGLVDRELKKADLWVTANSSRAKKNYHRFMTNWLGNIDPEQFRAPEPEKPKGPKPIATIGNKPVYTQEEFEREMDKL